MAATLPADRPSEPIPDRLHISARAADLHSRSLVVDTHVDTTQRLYFDRFDLAVRDSTGCLDIPRLRDGGVGAVFFALWVPGTITGQVAVESGFGQIGAIRRQLASHPEHLTLARTASDIQQARLRGKIAILLGIEGGHLISSDLGVLRKYAAAGVRYMTLTHSLNTEWADSSTDSLRHGGLSKFGKTVVREMNRLGMMIDISHVSDAAFCDALSVSRAPLIASHSNCRALCDSPRNLTDEMIRALAAAGGVIHINFHTGFLSQTFRDAMKSHPDIQQHIEREANERCGSNQACQLLEREKITRKLVEDGKLPRVDWSEIISHIDHAVNLVGAEHVGIGSDFDGANMPCGMEDAAHLPRITAALLEKGYPDSDIQKILGGNTLRLMQDVEAIASELNETEESE